MKKYTDSVDRLLNEFKKGKFVYGPGCINQVGRVTVPLGKRILLARTHFPGVEPFVETIRQSVSKAGGSIVEELVDAVRPNAPVEDMLGIRVILDRIQPDVVISLGGGSTIDAVKSAIVLHVLGGDIEDYFGVGLVTEALARSGKTLLPHVAIQTAASSAAHLTKYSNITNLETNQKKLIVDEAVVPQVPIFDYSITYKTPLDLSLDGALDGMSHCLEVYFGSVNGAQYQKAEAIATTAISLVVNYLPRVIADPDDKEARNAICAATDLGGYAIMIGGTSGAHLTSFSLVDLMSHGRACALMNPYYSVFYATAIEEPLRKLGAIYKTAGYSQEDFNILEGRELGMAFARAMIKFAQSIQFPTRLSQIDGFGQDHVDRILNAAKNPQLKSKLENMPVPLTAQLVDEYMGSIIEAATTGQLETIKNL
jgi:alcohol dehydrogenase